MHPLIEEAQRKGAIIRTDGAHTLIMRAKTRRGGSVLITEYTPGDYIIRMGGLPSHLARPIDTAAARKILGWR